MCVVHSVALPSLLSPLSFPVCVVGAGAAGRALLAQMAAQRANPRYFEEPRRAVMWDDEVKIDMAWLGQTFPGSFEKCCQVRWIHIGNALHGSFCFFVHAEIDFVFCDFVGWLLRIMRMVLIQTSTPRLCVASWMCC